MFNRRSFLGLSTLPILAKPAWLSKRSFLEKFFGITSATKIMGDDFGSWTTAYKVVGYTNLSPLAYNYNPLLTLEYRKEKFTYPNIGKVFVYKDFESALCLSIFFDRKILEVKCKNIKSQYKRLSFYDMCNIKLVESFWKGSKDIYIDKCDDDVYTCDYLKVIKEVKLPVNC